MKKLTPLFMSKFGVAIFSMLAAFITYCSMYAFRKPFTAAIYEGQSIWGLDYKIILIITQVLGYMLSKFIGIRLISEMQPAQRIRFILSLMGIAWAALLLLATTPPPYNFVWMFLNGLPLGMIWGLVFSFLEGRRNTELLGAGMSASFIVASGLVKSVGKYLLDDIGVSEFWMPVLTGLIFMPFLLLGVWMLSRISPPDEADIEYRTKRIPMDRKQRRAFFGAFAPGIVVMVGAYMALTIFRDLRDNFAVEIWALLGYSNQPRILATAEIPIAILVFVVIALMIFIQNNRRAFYANIGMILGGGILLVLTTWLFQQHWIGPIAWMISSGLGMYLAYVSYHTMFFERWIARFQIPSNIGFLMYTADAFGYLGSVGILFYKNFGPPSKNWLTFIMSTSYITGFAVVVLSVLGLAYFLRIERKNSRPAFH